MEFLLYLSSETSEIYKMISKKVRIVENMPICRKHDIFGWYENVSKTVVICTDRILSKPNPEYNINMVILHESIHVAQACKQNMWDIKPFGISKSSMNLSDNLKKDLRKVIGQFGSIVADTEIEAFWMEDKPNEVKYVFQKYCM